MDTKQEKNPEVFHEAHQEVRFATDRKGASLDAKNMKPEEMKDYLDDLLRDFIFGDG